MEKKKPNPDLGPRPNPESVFYQTMTETGTIWLFCEINPVFLNNKGQLWDIKMDSTSTETKVGLKGIL